MNKDQLVTGAIYEVQSRNLAAGAYDGNEGFIGIRTKFDDEYLFTEYLCREQGGTQIPFDTVQVIRQIGTVPDEIPLLTQLGTVCVTCNQPTRWSGPPAPAPWVCDGGCANPCPKAVENTALFDVLQQAVQQLNT